MYAKRLLIAVILCLCSAPHVYAQAQTTAVPLLPPSLDHIIFETTNEKTHAASTKHVYRSVSPESQFSTFAQEVNSDAECARAKESFFRVA